MVQQNICTTKQNNDTGHTDTVLYYTMNIKAVWKVFIVTYSKINVTILTHCGSFLPWLHKTWSTFFRQWLGACSAPSHYLNQADLLLICHILQATMCWYNITTYHIEFGSLGLLGMCVPFHWSLDHRSTYYSIKSHPYKEDWIYWALCVPVVCDNDYVVWCYVHEHPYSCGT